MVSGSYFSKTRQICQSERDYAGGNMLFRFYRTAITNNQIFSFGENRQEAISNPELSVPVIPI
ncbi:hypothetical protein HMPREF9137_0846 [Prevotella denticola F0289]|nr:hypothetical protein HMPREF9137_0846 [Prevotella denticola F0289]